MLALEGEVIFRQFIHEDLGRASNFIGERAGALIVDVRTDHQFDDAHIGGTVCIPQMRGWHAPWGSSASPASSAAATRAG